MTDRPSDRSPAGRRSKAGTPNPDRGEAARAPGAADRSEGEGCLRDATGRGRFLPFIVRAGREPQALTAAMRMLTRDPALVQFQARGGGRFLLCAILQLHARAPDRDTRELDLVPFGHIFRRSRSHSCNLIAAMDQFIADTVRSSEMAYRRAEAASQSARPE